MINKDSAKTCSKAVESIRRLRELARSTGYPATGEAEMDRLVQAVESVANAVRGRVQEAIRAESECDQPELF